MEGVDSDEGLIVLRASRLEALVEPLRIGLEATCPPDVLAPQTVIAAHAGVKQWLTSALARAVGPARIVANLDIVLPSVWLDRLSQALLGEQAVAIPAYRRAHLRWTLHALLQDPPADADEPRMRAYLGRPASADERAQRRFQLADRLASVYSQYLVYRPDWLAAWEAGRWPHATTGSDDSALQELEVRLLAPLWRHVANTLGRHRAGALKSLLQAVGEPHRILEPLHVFGLSHLPPAELGLLRQYARRSPVFLYVPDPCREYWGGLHRAAGDGRWRAPSVEAWQGYGEAESRRLAVGGADLQAHPLLARWGRMGQHFFASLADGEVREDTRHWQDEQPTLPENRLARLQESIRRLDAALMLEDVCVASAREDASLRIHACHTRQRELEVLRDALLDAVQAGIRPGGIVVMAPAIEAYLPLVPAVFGESGSTRERLLPYHLADVPVARSHSLFSALDQLLAIGASRLSAPEVVDLLAVPEVRRALDLSDDQAEALVEWLRKTRVAWGLDASHKQGFSIPQRAEFTFAWALDRMLAGYLMADAPNGYAREAITLPDGTRLLPQAGIEGPAAVALGSLDRLLGELAAWRSLAQTEQKASAWTAILLTRVESVFQIDPADADARTAISAIRRAIHQLATEPARNGLDPQLRFSVVADFLRDALSEVPERQRFLMGGVTFCGMVPQRAVPFDVVCVLGLNEGEFPRQPSDGGVDLMPRLRRLGDRDAAGDDRYLFLETVMSTRQRLHLSYVGQGVRDGKHRNPAAPLAELMTELDRQCGLPVDAPENPQPWLVRHPLQPFDDRYFSIDAARDPALFSYSQRFAGMAGRGRSPLPPFRNTGDAVLDPLQERVRLRDLIAYFKDPARGILKDDLHVSLDALDRDARLPEDEPLDGIARVHAVARETFLRDVLPRACADANWAWDRAMPDWVEHGGMLPLGAQGEIAWQAEANAVEALWARAAASERFDGPGRAGGEAVRIDVVTPLPEGHGSVRVFGTLRNVFPLRGHSGGQHVVFAFPKANAKTHLKTPNDLHFGDRVPAFLHWALLRLNAPAAAPVRLTMLAEDEPDLAQDVNAWDKCYVSRSEGERHRMLDDLGRRVGMLVSIRRQACAGLGRYYPRTGWKAVRALEKAANSAPQTLDEETKWATARSAAAEAWPQGHGHSGEREQQPGYARLLEGELNFGDPESDPGRIALEQLVEDCLQLRAIMRLPIGLDLDPAEEGAA